MTIDDRILLTEVIERIQKCEGYRDKLKEFNSSYIIDTKILIQDQGGIYKQTNIENNDSNR